MASEVHNRLEGMQTGQYIPSEEEQEISENPPKIKKIFGTTAPTSEEFGRVSRVPVLNMENSYLAEQAAAAGWGQSKFDRGTFEPGMDLENARAIEQSGFSKILNGALKGGVVAATTAVETVAGVIDGIFEGGIELGRQLSDDKEGVDASLVVGRGVNNTIARTMTDIQKLSEEWFPNYRTAEERTDRYQDEWYKHIFTANFIGDSFLKNFGFTVGALAGGAAWSKALSAGMKALSASNLMKGVVAAAEGNAEAKAALETTMKVINAGAASTVDGAEAAKGLAAGAKGLLKMSTTQQLIGGVIAAMGEGTFEGIMARSEFLENRLGEIENDYQEALSDLTEVRFAENIKDTDCVIAVPVVYADGTRDIKYELNEKGRDALAKARKKAFDDYAFKKQYAEELGDRVAATTFVWNIPVLTVSNTMQFGRMLSGGFNTARKVAKTTGKIAKNAGKLSGSLKGVSFGKEFAKLTARNGWTEAAEEMSQGFISSGAKHVADARLTSFNDDGYNKQQLESLGDWVGMMLEGGMDYLKEGRNWQEGFLGMLTGVIGIPGRHWNGGMAEAFREAKQKARDSQAAADALNTLVGSEKFQNAVKGLVRHGVYDQQMEEAVQADDKYSWKTANDKQLVNDIITFANAGRLQDLMDIVDYYAGMSDNDSDGLDVLDASTGEHNETEVRNNPGKVVANVKEQAKTIKDNIELYNQMYDSMSAIAPMGASRNQIEEMVAVAMNIKAFEKRYLSMFDEVIKGLEKYVEPLKTTDENGNALNTAAAQLQRAKDIYSSITRIFTDASIPSNPTILDDFEATSTMSKLRETIKDSGDTELLDKIDDMKKLTKDISAFVEKLITLKNLDPSEYDKVAVTPDKVVAEQKKEEALKESEEFDSYKAVYDKFKSEQKKNLGDVEGFVDRLRRMVDSNPHAKKFIDIYDTYNELRRVFLKNNGNPNALETEFLERLFDGAKETGDIVDTSRLESYDAYTARLRNEISSGDVRDMDKLLAIRSKMDISKETYDSALDKVSKAMQDLSGLKETMRSSKSGKPVSKSAIKRDVHVADGEGKEPAQPATKAPAPKKTRGKKAVLSEDKKIAQDSIGRNWTVGEEVYCYDSTKDNQTPEKFTITGFREEKNGNVIAELSGPREMSVSLKNQTPFINKGLPSGFVSTASSEEIPAVNPTAEQLGDEAIDNESIPTPDEVDAASEENKYGQVRYYQTAIPEFALQYIKDFREANKIKDPALRKQKKKEILKKIKSFISENPTYQNIWEKLESENAWTNAVLHVEVGDKVQFIAFPGEKYSYKGKPFIFMAVEKDGKRYIFNAMRRKDSFTREDGTIVSYEGLKDFLDAFDAAWEKHLLLNPNTEFVFPKTSTVWAKPGGIIDYSYAQDFSDETAVTKVEGYDENAPIVWVTSDGRFETLRGDKFAAASVYTWGTLTDKQRAAMRGNVYYLANDGNGGHIPVRLGIEHFTSDNYMSDNPAFADVRRILTRIEGIAGRFFDRVKEGQEERDKILEEENKALHEEVANLRKRINLTHGFFTFQFNKSGEPILIYDGNANTKNAERDENNGTVKVGFVLGENNYGRLIEKFAEQGESFDFYPSRNFNEFLKNGMLTTNARKLLPKNMDVYIEHWENGGFVETQKQKELIESVKPVTVTEPKTPKAESAFEDDLADIHRQGGLSSGFSAVEDFDESELSPEQAPAAVSGWDSVSAEQQKALIDHYGESVRERWDELSDEDKNDMLDCVGVI